MCIAGSSLIIATGFSVLRTSDTLSLYVLEILVLKVPRYIDDLSFYSARELPSCSSLVEDK